MGFAGRFECSHIHCCCSPVLGMVVPSSPSSPLLPDVGLTEIYQGERFGSRGDLKLQGEGVSLLTTACFAIQPRGGGRLRDSAVDALGRSPVCGASGDTLLT